ncbi:MAG TPA: deoxyguanosinetriphosphate triphosphohydrolase [Terriglobales bacterium]|jgi:dGTPase|nr:deoxyguanosinetriphosphate triphosphohydrolase [Terriglobales bacterium]
MYAPYALHPEESRGRRYPEPPHPYRSDFQRDRDRVIHSRAFRRLENKTQVFTYRGSDHFRNRLTHTIEVAQIARTVASALGLNSDLTETLALVHDIGHPPFGHAGEHALDREMRACGDIFDHNLHALRIVEHFELRYPEFRGLNLTFEVREGIIKHSRDWNAQEFPELAEYLLDQRPPLEAQLIDVADEIAYNAADLDDGVESGIISIQMIREHLPFFERIWSEVENSYPDVLAKLKFSECLRRVLDHMVSDLIHASGHRIRTARIHRASEVRAYPQRLLGFSPEVEVQRRETKAFLHERLYDSPGLSNERVRLEELISELFRFWVSRPEELPQSYQEQLAEEKPERVVCDYIAGMTDSFVLREYEREKTNIHSAVSTQPRS